MIAVATEDPTTTLEEVQIEAEGPSDQPYGKETFEIITEEQAHEIAKNRHEYARLGLGHPVMMLEKHQRHPQSVERLSRALAGQTKNPVQHFNFAHGGLSG